MAGFNIRWPTLALAAGAGMLTACSLHPLPDDVSRYSTEEIVRNVRCETKEAVRERIQLAMHDAAIVGIIPDRVLEPGNLEQIRRVNPKLANTFVAYGASTIAYRFDFDVTESNHNDGSLTFALPFNTGTFALDLGGKLNKDREGQRTFTMAETFQKLVYLNCDDWVQANRNIVYPATGSIGMGKIINAFMDVSQLGGGHDKFTDDITFTTTVRGKLNPTLELAPVLNRFQLAKATGEFESKRVDTHKLKVSLAFPDLSMVGVASAVSAAAIPRLADETKNRALINICIAEGESRENQFNTLREISPKEYCRRNDTSAPW